jgi:hypothetical protein
MIGIRDTAHRGTAPRRVEAETEETHRQAKKGQGVTSNTPGPRPEQIPLPSSEGSNPADTLISDFSFQNCGK